MQMKAAFTSSVAEAMALGRNLAAHSVCWNQISAKERYLDQWVFLLEAHSYSWASAQTFKLQMWDENGSFNSSSGSSSGDEDDMKEVECNQATCSIQTNRKRQHLESEF